MVSSRQVGLGLATSVLIILGLSGALNSRYVRRSRHRARTPVQTSSDALAYPQALARQMRTGLGYERPVKKVEPAQKQAQIVAAVKNVRRTRKTFSVARKVYKKAARRAKRKGATPADKKAARRSRNAVRKASLQLRAALKRLRALQGSLSRKLQKGPTVGTKKQIIAARKVARTANAVLNVKRKAYESAMRKVKIEGSTPYDKKAARRALRAFQVAAKRRKNALNRLRALLQRKSVNKAVTKLYRKGQKIRVNRLPKTCYCKQLPVGESKCYYFTRGKYCKSRACKASYVCTGKRKNGGTMCLLRRVKSKVVPVGYSKNTCRRVEAKIYMYIPYAMY